MRIRKCAVVAVLVFTLIATTSYAQVQEKSERVSLVQLIANPERYEDKLIQVTGFVRIEFEDNAIWLHKDDFDNHIYANALWINVNECVDWDGKPMSGYASLGGRFNSKRHGHGGLFPSEISQVGECFPVPPARAGT